jgi:hypothetical protein
MLEAFVLDFGRTFGKEVDIDRERLTRLGHEEQITYLLGCVRNSGVVLPEASELEIRALAEVFRANLEALRRYTPAGDYPGHVVEVRPSALRLEGSDLPSTWSRLVRGTPELIEIQGDHYSLLLEPNITALARALGPFLP